MKNNYTFQSRAELAAFIKEEIINTTEALELLGCSRQNLNKLVKSGTLVPIKEMSRDRIFFKQDILDRIEKLNSKKLDD